jgi:hypothetical protein
MREIACSATSPSPALPDRDQHAVDAVLDGQALRAGLHVDVGGVGLQRVVQRGAHQPHDRARVLGDALEGKVLDARRHGAFRARRAAGWPWRTGLPRAAPGRRRYVAVVRQQPTTKGCCTRSSRPRRCARRPRTGRRSPAAVRPSDRGTGAIWRPRRFVKGSTSNAGCQAMQVLHVAPGNAATRRAAR